VTTAVTHRGSRLYVKKFGGTSLGSLERIEIVAEQLAEAYHLGELQVIVCSAMAGETNRLYALAQQLDENASARELDMLASTGEQVSIALLAIALQKRGISARSLLASQLPIRTSASHGAAEITQIETSYLLQLLQEGIVPIIAGFQGINANGDITTLGRGGSDTTAVAIAAALHAEECQIFTDVDGVFTTDPAIEPSARRLDAISFTEMLALARNGAKVLHPDSVATAQRCCVPLRVLSSFNPGRGTLIVDNLPRSSGITGIAVAHNQALLTKAVTVGNGDFNQQMRQLLQHCGVAFESNDTVSDSWFVVGQQHITQVVTAMERQPDSIPVNCQSSLTRLSLVGAIVSSFTSISNELHLMLDGEGIDVKLSSWSATTLSVWVDEANADKAVRVLHHAFGLNKAQ